MDGPPNIAAPPTNTARTWRVTTATKERVFRWLYCAEVFAQYVVCGTNAAYDVGTFTTRDARAHP